MAWHIGADNISSRTEGDISIIAQKIKECKGDCTIHPIGPNKEAVAQSLNSGDTLVFVVGGNGGATFWSFAQDLKGSGVFTIFAFAAWDPAVDKEWCGEDAIANRQIVVEWDAGQFMNASSTAACEADIAGCSAMQYAAKYPDVIGMCVSEISPEDIAQKICSGTCGSAIGGAATTQGGGSMIKIPDLTFYGLIKQICGAVDATFTIANNMAYLLSFKDLYKYRDKYDEYIPILTADKIQNDTLTKNWTTDGFYNAVNITYNGGELEYKYEPLIEQYGENVFYYDLSEDDEETATAKAKALLSAHVRDYSLDLELRCLYDPHITTGSWIKLPTKITRMSVSQDKEIPKQNNNIPNRETTIETEYDIFYVQGYSLRWTTQNALIMDLHLKYGPDTPEDPVNATIGTGAVQTTQGTGGYGSDCFSVGDFCQLFGDHRIPHSGAGAVAYAKENTPDNNMTMPRARQGSTYDRDLAGKTAEEGFLHITSIAGYCLYAENCNKWCCVEDMYTSGECGFNCGDWSLFVKVMLDCVGVKSWGFHIDGHYFNMMEYNGEVMSIDASRRQDANTHSCGFPASSKGSCSCACVNGNLGVHTDSSSCNATSNNTQQK